MRKKNMFVAILIIFLSSFMFVCKNNVESEILTSIGNAYLPLRSSISDSIVRNGKILFLDLQSSNIIISSSASASISESMYNQELNLIIDGTLFNDTILKKPISMCIDNKQNIYIAQIENKVVLTLNFPHSKNYDIELLPSNETIPFNLMQVDKENKIIEYNMLLKIPELRVNKLMVSTIVYWNDYLVVAFLTSPTLLFIDTRSLDESSLKYFFSTQQDEVVDLGSFNESIWVLHKNEIISYNINNYELIQKEKVTINPVSKNADLLFRKKDNTIILFDPKSSNQKIPQIQKVNLRSLSIESKPVKSIYYVFSLQENNISEIFAFKETSQKTQKELHLYQEIFQIK